MDTLNPTVKEVLRKLPLVKLQRLIEIKNAYPDIPLNRLPGNLQIEAREILQSADKALHQEANKTPPAQPEIAQEHKDHAKLYSIIGTDLNEGIDIAISQKARLQTTHLIGGSGTGKSTVVANLVNSDSKNGLGMAVLDPHGDLIKAIIAGLPENRVKDVIYLNIEDVEHPYGLNLYECQRLTIRDMAKTASFVSQKLF
jgi:hypothetical protein